MQTENSLGVSQNFGMMLWIALIAVLSVGGSLVFACAAPLAAMAAFAGITMERKSGLVLVATAWVSNQIVGYGLLGYPQDFNSFAWGAAIGVASIIAYFAARAGANVFKSSLVRIAADFAAAFAAYELVLFFSGILLGATDSAFSTAVVARIFEVNAVAFMGLLAAHRIAIALLLLRSPARQHSVVA